MTSQNSGIHIYFSIYWMIELNIVFLDFEFSIGSLGAGDSEAHVSDVVVNRVNFSGTTNGVRIKTWQVSL